MPVKKEKVISLKGDEAEELASPPSSGPLPSSTDHLPRSSSTSASRTGPTEQVRRVHLLLTTLSSLLCLPPADLSANLKSRVSKPQAQKTLAALHEKGEIMGKVYGKTTVYCALQVSGAVVAVARREGADEQSDTDSLDPEAVAELEATIKELKEEETALKEEIKTLSRSASSPLLSPSPLAHPAQPRPPSPALPARPRSLCSSLTSPSRSFRAPPSLARC